MAGVMTLADAIARFLTPDNGYGSGYGYGSGSGSGSGDGYGDGYGSGYGDGSGDGYGSGDGSGDGYGDGYGYGYGYGYGIATFGGDPVHNIDGLQTIIRSVHGNVAMGEILQADLTLKKCYVVKGSGYFAHGDTLPAAMEALRDKLFEDMPEDERIEAFLSEFKPGEKYPAKLFYEWHHRLTGSCEMGRKDFANTHGIDIDNDTMTREEFAELTKNAYGGEVIQRLMKAFEQAL